METNRQKKIAGLLQEDLGDILGRAVQSGGLTNLIISVTKVAITVDLTQAKVYLTFFLDDSLEYLSQIEHSLKGEENPIENPELLIKRKKS